MDQYKNQFAEVEKLPSYSYENDFWNHINCLLLGGNFLFSKRLYEILKRNFSIINYEQKFDTNENDTFEIQLEAEKKLFGLIAYKGVNTILISSEFFLFIKDDLDFKSFIKKINSIKEKLLVKVVFISIKNLIDIQDIKDRSFQLRCMEDDEVYSKRLETFKLNLDSSKDLIFEFSSFYTYIKSKIQINPFYFLQENDSKVLKYSQDKLITIDFSDDVIHKISSNLGQKGFYKIGNEIDFIHLSKLIKNFKSIANQKDNFFKEEINNSSKNKTESTTFDKGLCESNLVCVAHQTRCSLNLLYRYSPQDSVANKPVAAYRLELGAGLAKVIPENVKKKLDLIVPVPETGKYYAQGLSNELSIPYAEAFIKRKEIGRSLDIGNADLRKDFIWSKLALINEIVDFKKIGIVDEAIFTGATLKIACELLNRSKVSEVYIFIPSPECKYRCKFDMLPNRTLLSEYVRDSALPSYFDVNGVYFQSESFYEKFMDSSSKFCKKCFIKPKGTE